MKKKKTMQTQHTFNFDAPPKKEPEKIQTDTSLPPPLTRPDRQIIYPDAKTHYDWPSNEALHDRDTISVDRVNADIDGPAHRFVIKRGDTIEAWFSKDKQKLGTVVGISHARQEVSVAFRPGQGGVWFSVGCIYPALEQEPAKLKNAKPLSTIVEKLNTEYAPENGFTEADCVLPPKSPFLFDDYKAFRKEMAEGTLTYSTYQEDFKRLLASKEAIIPELQSRFKAKPLALLAARLGDWNAKRNSKPENAKSIYRKMLASFLLDGSVSFAMGESYEDAITKKVLAVTEADWDGEQKRSVERAAEHEKALTNPETLGDFRAFIDLKGEEALTEVQFARWDKLHAEMTRENRASNQANITVTSFTNDEITPEHLSIKEGYHSKRNCPLWIVQLATRVERETYKELNRKAKMLGGWYSSFKKEDAGFQFLEQEKAESFISLLTGNVDRSDVLSDRKERRELTASERLHKLADAMLTQADETIEGSHNSLQNTARRADMQAGVRERAYSNQALANTMHSIAEALGRGEAQFLDGLRHRTHIQTLETVLYLAHWSRIRAIRKAQNENEYGFGLRVQEEEEKPAAEIDSRFAEYPYPHLYKRHLEEAVLKCGHKKGLRMISNKVAKRIRHEKEEYITLTHESDIELVGDFLSRVKATGFDTDYIDSGFEKYNRLQKANIHTLHELRTALREYLPHRASKTEDDPVKVAERELIGKKIPGFFPTPRLVIQRMLDLADIQGDHRVLEPSCGIGSILDGLRGIENENPIVVYAIERNRTFQDVLFAKGYAVDYTDFLTYQGEHDRIVMNPPFEKGQDIDHVRHAYQQLASGGRLVSVMSEGPFFRSDAKSIAFRNWLDELAADTYPLPEDSFKGIEAFRETGVRTRLVVIDKA